MCTLIYKELYYFCPSLISTFVLHTSTLAEPYHAQWLQTSWLLQMGFKSSSIQEQIPLIPQQSKICAKVLYMGPYGPNIGSVFTLFLMWIEFTDLNLIVVSIKVEIPCKIWGHMGEKLISQPAIFSRLQMIKCETISNKGRSLPCKVMMLTRGNVKKLNRIQELNGICLCFM